MEKIVFFITERRRTILVAFAALAVLFGAMIPMVEVNDDLAGYLPPDAPSTKALDVMDREFTAPLPNAELTAPDVTIPEAMEMKAALAKLPGVSDVIWLDDVYDVRQPIGMGDPDTIDEFYKDGDALFSLAVDDGMGEDVEAAATRIAGEGATMEGAAMESSEIVGAAETEIIGALKILLPLVVIILILATSSWAEPLYFLIVIGVSIVINMGTNIFLGEVSFITYAVSPILQLACSLDYAVFLLHSFDEHRRKHEDPLTAMRAAIKESMSVVAASAATTVFGFFALNFMNFRIGADLGINLMKGIALSFASVMILLPALTLLTYKFIDRTRHRPFMPGFKRIGRAASFAAVPVVAIVLLIVVPCFLGQGRTEFVYNYDVDAEVASVEEAASAGSDGTAAPNGDTATATAAATAAPNGDEHETIIALLVPRGEPAKEKLLSDALKRIDHVTGVVSYATEVGAEIPAGFLTEDVTDNFYSENYARIIVYTDTPPEGDEAFRAVEDVNAASAEYYGGEALSLGESVNTYDMSNLVRSDNVTVNLIAIISIFFVLLITFRSALLPFILLLTIETSIWINLSIPYFEGSSINFLGYLVLSAVQLGTTVDYAILLTNKYLTLRRALPTRAAVEGALGESFRSILVSAAVLSAAGFSLYGSATNPAVTEIGLLLGRGTLLSLLMVSFFLPAMLLLCDRAIGKLTYKSSFWRPARGASAHPERL
ncbi:MAG: MMPL family transporter [Clostridiales Family XIII bacterium]|jgi:predicted RND superfamily exporter protein|nr:MMPL family transporter [Clostridiales Family XIII bacterium]